MKDNPVLLKVDRLVTTRLYYATSLKTTFLSLNNYTIDSSIKNEHSTPYLVNSCYTNYTKQAYVNYRCNSLNVFGNSISC